MKPENKGVGLDIGTTKIVAMLGRKNEYGKLKIIGAGKSESLGVHRGVVNNITQTISSGNFLINQEEFQCSYKNIIKGSRNPLNRKNIKLEICKRN